jgi:hypothetical protein
MALEELASQDDSQSGQGFLANAPKGKGLTPAGQIAMDPKQTAELLANMQSMVDERTGAFNTFLGGLKDASAWGSGGVEGPSRALAGRDAEKAREFNDVYNMRTQMASYRAAQAQQEAFNEQQKNMFGGGYEPGALLHAVNKYQSKQVFLTQDSMELIDLNFLLTPDENIIKSYLIEDRPARFLSPDQIAWIKERFNNRIFEGLSNGNALVSSTFLGSREAIDKIIQQDILVESKLPRFKRDQECWERVMGIAFDSNGYTHKCFPECFKKTLMGRQ